MYCFREIRNGEAEYLHVIPNPLFQIKDWGSKALVVLFLVKGLNKLSEMGKKQEECILRRQIWELACGLAALVLQHVGRA